MAKRGGGVGAKKPGNGGVKIGMKKGGVQKAKATKAKPMQGVKGTLKSKMQQAGKSFKGPGGGGTQRPGAPKPQVQGGGGKRHTLLLKQETTSASSRAWSDYTSVNEAVDGFVSSYEAKLRNLNPGQKQLTYSVADLQQYVDSMHDISLLVSDPQTKQYAPKGKAFLKQMLMSRLKSAVA